MKIAIVGTGYVGLVSGACFADLGVDVTCVDTNQAKIDALLQGEIPNYKLFTLTTYFGVKQQGNRAVDQAMTNAKLFLEIAKWQSFLAWISCVKEFD